MADSDDDKPISALLAERAAAAESSSSAKPVAPADVKVERKQPLNGAGATNKQPSEAASSSSSSAAPKINKKQSAAASDSEDDMPIGELIKRRMNAAGNGGKEKAPAAKKPKTDNDKAKSAPTSSSARALAGNPLSVEFYDTNKGFIVQKLLVRWWYAIEWPKKEEIKAFNPPPGYEPLDGFPGVFVSTRVRTGTTSPTHSVSLSLPLSPSLHGRAILYSVLISHHQSRIPHPSCPFLLSSPLLID